MALSEGVVLGSISFVLMMILIWVFFQANKIAKKEGFSTHK